jgi:hypothetical protein
MAGFYNQILNCANVDFRQTGQPTAQVTTDGDILLGATAAPNIRKGTLTSTGGTITISYVAGTNPSLNFETTGGQSITNFDVDAHSAPGTDPVVPNASGTVIITGGQTAPGTISSIIQTKSLAANTWTTQIQQTSAVAAKDTTKNGVSHFNSAQFTNDQGFVSVISGLYSASFMVDAFTGPGTNPVVPDATGKITMTGGQTAPGTISNIIQTKSLAANTWTTQIQQTSAVAAKDTTKNGVSHFNSAQFTNDQGFISIISGATFPWTDTSGAFNAAVYNGYFITAAATATLPASPSQGDRIQFIVDAAAALVVTANTGQKIRIANQVSSTAGTFTSALQGDALNLVYRASSTTWMADSSPCGIWIPS